ncbi:hypothetical protein LZG07_13915 [Microbacterium profundi]|uniref:hypothetical protein n=1 Tax=Microbacterium profundi TaxID=450380 RepID=UPI001F27D111|nr:hypothetical protein [Microbacterium profundi]MCE7483012.1 hypothetical protein [Microbacterium profundi]
MPSSEPPTRHERAGLLKERIYLTFAALAVVLTLGAHGHVDPIEAIRTLAVTVFGTLLAMFTADIISHLVVHERSMTGTEFRHASVTTFGALGAVVLPFVFLAASAWGLWDTETALRAASFALVAALIAIGFLAIRRVRLSWWKRALVLGVEAMLALIVIGLQVLAHG